MAGTIDVSKSEAPAVTSVEQRLEQIEAAIAAAHETCDRIKPQEASPPTERAAGALSAADGCIEALVRLNERLVDIAGLTGKL